MLNILMSCSFEKKYKSLPEVVRAQIKKTIKKMAINCVSTSLNTKKVDSKVYESSVNTQYKIIWECPDKKNARLLDIVSCAKTSETLNRLFEIDDEIKEKEKKISSSSEKSSMKYK